MVSPARPPGVMPTGPSTGRLKMPVLPLLRAPSMGGSLPTLTLSRSKLAFEGRSVAGDPADVVDVRDAPDLAYNLHDVLHAAGLEREPAEGRAVLDGVHPRRDDVHPCVRDARGYVLEEVHPVERLDEQLHREALALAAGPLNLDEPLGDRKSRRVGKECRSR